MCHESSKRNNEKMKVLISGCFELRETMLTGDLQLITGQQLVGSNFTFQRFIFKALDLTPLPPEQAQTIHLRSAVAVSSCRKASDVP